MANHLIENSVRNLFSRQKSLEAVFDCIPEQVYCRDIHGKIVYVNQALADVFQNVINARVSSDTHFFYETRIPGGLYPVPYVYDHMYQVMENLISNAEQAMPGGGTVTVSIENWISGKNYFSGTPALAHGNYVKIMVSDTGVGTTLSICRHLKAVRDV